MCLALPYRLIALLGPGRALAEGPDGVREVSTLALDAPRPGLHVLVAYGAAVREIEAAEADALRALLRAFSEAGP
ncbi:MAG: HypC/HybG/HupF family hydrogenase formation chaperone [Armatimonadota bacterium]|nr:HypC/HybG/HupF family hydrogenase formation chaperone [Armatimonadota bacterium]MDR7422286.1 HypC/HybG/HupF family hydrogenase formation chaperone [Armatimonadota bacterium]MDR7456291.1 HypC/HybG/HupF family hydrogenase formation chaperone [Armatimonadota bacterium]MDR7496288.1 HypC/HybG/HupF family hydrogenase formation chaperone [Armatimonadota bacterium]MDR7512223.1 HypC/HybG/HupF family hydrogenase formation chaperone [Armatimonadota bacterium]